MERAYDDWGYEFSIGSGKGHFGAYSQIMREARTRRWEACELLLDRLMEIAAMLTDRDTASMTLQLQTHKAELSRAVEAGATDEFPYWSL